MNIKLENEINENELNVINLLKYDENNIATYLNLCKIILEIKIKQI